MRRFQFRLDLSVAACEKYYRGQVNQVMARSTDGTSIQFPALLIKPFVSGNGVHGLFTLTCDDDGKNSNLQRVQTP
jgi:hypothetical protein